MTSKGISATCVLFPEGGHGFARPAKKAFNTPTGNFLQACLGGHAERIGDGLKGPSIQRPSARRDRERAAAIDGKQVSYSCLIAAAERVAYTRRSLFPVLE